MSDLTLEQRSESCCRLALCFDKDAWQSIPETYKTVTVISEWICNGLYKGTMLEALPRAFKDTALFDAILQLNPFLVSMQPQLFKAALAYLGDDYIDVVLAADKSFLAHLPEPKRTSERCYIAVEQSPQLLEYVPLALKTESLCLMAIAQSPCLRFVPKALLSEAMVDTAIDRITESEKQKRGVFIEAEDVACIPESKFTEALCAVILKNCLEAIKHLPAAMITRTLCLDALAGRELMGFMIDDFARYVPEHFRAEVVREAQFTRHIQPGELDDWSMDL